jgi:class 3 adenylate cyclase
MSESLEHWVGTSKILALVFTDVVGSTSLGRAFGDERWMQVLRKHFARARSLMSTDKCYEIKMIGDSFMVAFRSAVDALDFALAFHADTGHECVRIRAGIHVGPIRVFENDLFGMMVNYTKRVESTDNNAGFIVVSDEARNHVDAEKASRHSSLKFNNKLVKFKGFEEPQKVWRVTYPGMTRLDTEKRAAASKVISKRSPAGQVLSKILFG